MSDEVNRKTQRKPMILDESKADLQLQSPMFKLNVDCFEEWFEWLSLDNLLKLRRTCKRLQQVVDYFIRTNYPAVKIGYGKFYFSRHTLNKFKKYDSASVTMIKELRVYDQRLIEQIDHLKVILPQMKKFCTNANEFHGDFYEMILKWCSNLKYLSVYDIRSNKMIGDGNQWLSRQYPMIEHVVFEAFYGFDREIKELKTFFEINPNIQTFSTNHEFLLINRDCFLGSNIKIDRLDVQIYTHDMYQVCNLLNQLYDQGFYERVHMYMNSPYQVDIDNIATVHGMEKLYLSALQPQTILPPMPNLRELDVLRGGSFGDWESIARNWVNLERVYFYRAKSNVIAPFLRHATKLKEIKFDALQDGSHFENGIIDLAALNKERGTLTGATKVTIYVKENIFLSTKFAKTKTEFNLVTLKRAQAVEWTHYY